MSEEEVAHQFGQTLRMLAMTGGQLAERVARMRADAARTAQAQEAERARTTQSQSTAEARAAQDAQREERRRAESAQRDTIAAGRTVYGNVRSFDWSRDDIQRRVGEAAVASHLLRDHDPVARTANAWLLDEVRARYGANADEWLATAVARYQESSNETRDRVQAENDAQTHNNATPDGPIVVDVDGTATRNPDTTREQAKTHTAYGEAAHHDEAMREDLADADAANRQADAALDISTAAGAQATQTADQATADDLTGVASPTREAGFPHPISHDLNHPQQTKSSRPRGRRGSNERRGSADERTR